MISNATPPYMNNNDSEIETDRERHRFAKKHHTTRTTAATEPVRQLLIDDGLSHTTTVLLLAVVANCFSYYRTGFFLILHFNYNNLVSVKVFHY
jgi:hypothetical protein